MPYAQAIWWLPFTLGLTGAGLVLTWLAWRRRGAAAGLKGLSLSLLPLGAYLTGVLQLVWRIGAASIAWVTHLVFSPIVWAGFVLLGLSLVLYVVSTRLRAGAATAGAGAVPASERNARRLRAGRPGRSRGEPATDSGGDFAEIEQILRNRGIT